MATEQKHCKRTNYSKLKQLQCCERSQYVMVHFLQPPKPQGEHGINEIQENLSCSRKMRTVFVCADRTSESQTVSEERWMENLAAAELTA